MNRLKREQKIMRTQLSDIKNYPGAVISDPNVFFGPVTVAELKRSMELVPYYQQQIRKRRAQQLALASKQNESAETSYENKENIGISTFNSDDCTLKETTTNERLMNTTFDMENEDEICNAVEQKNDTVLNRTFELMDVTENINLQIDETMIPESKSASKRTYYRYRDNMQNTLISECSQLEDETFTDAIKFDFQKDISIANKTILTGFGNLQLNSSPVSGEISCLGKRSNLSTKAKAINDTQPIEDGLIPVSFCESDKENASVVENNDCKMSSYIDKRLLKLMQTPSKMSLTPIQDLTDAVLINTSDVDIDDEIKRSTPAVVNAKGQKMSTVSTPAPKTPTSLKQNLYTKNVRKMPTAVQLSQKTPTCIKEGKKTPTSVKSSQKTSTSICHQRTPTVYKNAKTPTTNSKISTETWEEKKPVSTRKVGSSKIPRFTTSMNPSPVAQYVKTGIPIPSMASKSRHSLCHTAEEKPYFLPRKSNVAMKTPDKTQRRKIFQTPSKSPFVGPIQYKKLFD